MIKNPPPKPQRSLMALFFVVGKLSHLPNDPPPTPCCRSALRRFHSITGKIEVRISAFNAVLFAERISSTISVVISVQTL